MPPINRRSLIDELADELNPKPNRMPGGTIAAANLNPEPSKIAVNKGALCVLRTGKGDSSITLDNVISLIADLKKVRDNWPKKAKKGGAS